MSQTITVAVVTVKIHINSARTEIKEQNNENIKLIPYVVQVHIHFSLRDA